MLLELSDTQLGAIILVIVLPLLYLLARVAAKIAEASTARLLAPLAPPIEGKIEKTRIRGRYRGRDILVSFSPDQSVGTGESATRINAFIIEALHVAGRQDWHLQFYITGWLGQGPKKLIIHAQDQALQERLRQSDVLQTVSEVSAPTQSYVTIRYQARSQRLTYTDDVSPEKVPSLEHYALQLALVDHLVAINTSVNPITIG
ncbi:hypothetical protein LZD49_34700 [Dyadobacter sp. CY261]|uniref:hypothetical protein n=1 Tax=Dyadobacter sp. CY261 TaxID=2907203 RepID=UPI001F15CEED|nr:hypothetical protein [Dyadobacter sp. CY261]MCF0075674.1 hypothetical protein [Dyadobacter sp. CY261]